MVRAMQATPAKAARAKSTRVRLARESAVFVVAAVGAAVALALMVVLPGVV
jgi:hypothetical protein